MQVPVQVLAVSGLAARQKPQPTRDWYPLAASVDVLQEVLHSVTLLGVPLSPSLEASQRRLDRLERDWALLSPQRHGRDPLSLQAWSGGQAQAGVEWSCAPAQDLI